MGKPMDRVTRRAIVLDTSALLGGFDPFSIYEEQYTPPLVKDELLGRSMPRLRLETAVQSGKLKVKTPQEASLKMVRESASTVGDTFYLSDTDLQILALALELKMHNYSPLIVTDDYSIQNVANQLGIEFASLATFGIRFRLKWMRYCPACHRRYPAGYKSGICEICGTELRRKPVGKRLLSSNEAQKL